MGWWAAQCQLSGIDRCACTLLGRSREQEQRALSESRNRGHSAEERGAENCGGVRLAVQGRVRHNKRSMGMLVGTSTQGRQRAAWKGGEPSDCAKSSPGVLKQDTTGQVLQCRMQCCRHGPRVWPTTTPTGRCAAGSQSSASVSKSKGFAILVFGASSVSTTLAADAPGACSRGTGGRQA